jgi:mevalonate pyrophosphate decarboxylase
MPSFLLPLYSPRSLMDWASSCRPRRPRYCLALLGGVCALIFLATISNTIFPPPAKKQINAIIASQSKNLKQARARYILKNNRPPPPNFDKWFKFARENKCLIDDYDQIHRDFEPFYRISEENSTHFQNMIRMGLDMVRV